MQLVHNLVGSGQALLGIINDILDLSKIEAGHFELAEVDFDPRELIAEITDLFGERCTSKGVEFIYFVAEEVPHHLTGDPARLRHRHPVTPYAGQRLSGVVHRTWLRGVPVTGEPHGRLL